MCSSHPNPNMVKSGNPAIYVTLHSTGYRIQNTDFTVLVYQCIIPGLLSSKYYNIIYSNYIGVPERTFVH